DRVAQPLDRRQLDPEIDLRRDLVHMLAAWPGGASGANGDRTRWDANGLGHDDRAHASYSWATWSSCRHRLRPRAFAVRSRPRRSTPSACTPLPAPPAA